MSKPDDILVSCLSVTLPVPQRFRYFQTSLAAYCGQTHANRELVVVLDQGADDAKSAIAAEVASRGRSDIRIVNPPAKLSLGALRNVSVASARGEVLCQWDDDDLHHPERIERQLEAMTRTRSDAVWLEEVMQYFPALRSLYCTHWSATETRGMPGTMMCRRAARIRYPETGPAARLGEDTAVALQLQQDGGCHFMAGAPHLFVYVSHGANAWPDAHHRMLANELGISRGLLRRREAPLRNGLRPFDFGPGAVTVQGYNGPAFIIDTGPRGQSLQIGGPVPG